MKIIRYKLNNPINTGTEQNPVWKETLYDKGMPYTEENEKIAILEAHNGEYVVEEVQE